MRQNILIGKGLFIAVLAMLVLLGVVSAGVPASAIGDTYYDNGDIAQNGAEIAGVVGKTPYVQKASLSVKVYFDSARGGRINIADYAFCPANTKYDDSGTSGATGQGVTQYFVSGVNSGGGGKVGKKNDDCRGTLTFDVNFTSDQQDNDTGLYIATLEASHLGSGGANAQNMFKITTSGSFISHAKKDNGDGSEVTVEQVNSSPRNIDYRIPFGSDCSVKEKIKKSIALYDLDNGGNSGAQEYGKVTIRLNANGSTRKFKVSSESDQNKVSLAEDSLVASAQPNGENRSVYIWFWAYPEEFYSLELNNVYNNNTIQYSLPFDGIYAKRNLVECWEVAPTSYIKKSTQSNWKTRDISVKAGDTVDFRQVAENIGSTTADTTGIVMKKWSSQTIPDSELEERWAGSPRPSAPREGAYSDWRTININNLKPGDKQDNSYVPNSFTIPKDVPYTGTEYYTVTVTKTRIVKDPDTGEDVEETYQEDEIRSRPVTKYWNPPDGTRYCFKYKIDHSKKNKKRGAFDTTTTDELCAVVGASTDEYDLTPTVSFNPRVYSYYPNINVTGKITSSGSISGSHAWEMYAVRYRSRPDSLVMKGDAGANANPCRKIPAGDKLGGCELFSSNTVPSTYTNTVPYRNGGPDELGSALCFFVRVQSPDESMDGRWRYSDMDCAVSGVSPRVQIWGGDAKVTGDIETVMKTINGKQIGSWGEYGVFSNGTNYNMGSGAGLRDAPTSRSVQDWNAMTFANNSATYGRFAGNLGLPTINAEGTRVTGDLTINDVDNIIDIDGRDSIADNDIRGVVYVTGTLRITNDLRYPATAASIRNIPRVILIANDVVIESDVTEIDPWIVARNRISTCGDDLETPELDGVSGFQPLSSLRLLSSAKCDNQLKFNGPVITPKIYLYRTYDSSDGSAAEIFNLRASNFLSSYVGTGIDEPIASTDNIQETAPRF